METNNHSHSKNEIITLILADLRNRKLLMGLEAAGLSTDDFHTNLSELIFSKMEISKEYEAVLFNWYEDAVYTLLNTDLNKFRQNQLFLATGIYDALEVKRKQLQTNVFLSSKRRFHFFNWSGLWKFEN